MVNDSLKKPNCKMVLINSLPTLVSLANGIEKNTELNYCYSLQSLNMPWRQLKQVTIQFVIKEL